MQHLTAKPIRTTNRNSSDYVRNGVPFTNSNGQLFGRWESPYLYAVYSYGPHWPLFVWADGEWFENEDRYSPTTSKHRTQSHPRVETAKVSRTWLRTMIANPNRIKKEAA